MQLKFGNWCNKLTGNKANDKSVWKNIEALRLQNGFSEYNFHIVCYAALAYRVRHYGAKLILIHYELTLDYARVK